MSINYASA